MGAASGREQDAAAVVERPREILQASGRYPLHRLCGERVLTVNTAAAGGNAALMTLAVQGVSAGGLPLHGPVIGGG